MISIDEEVRKQFEADWKTGRSLSIREYLPKEDGNTYLGTLEELVCIDLEFRWRQSKGGSSNSEGTVSVDEAAVPTRVEDYVRDFPELDDPEILRRLIEQEIHVRVTAGYIVEPGEYQSRFPSIAVDESLFSGDQLETVGQGESESTTFDEFPQPFGSYILTGLLGRGGMGAVYRARQPSAARDVAIKVADTASMNSFVRELICKRFETEAHAAAGIAHDNVVPIYDVGFVDEAPFYAMRLVDGGDLGAMSKGQPLPGKQAATYIRGIALGLAAAHKTGMLHRDIKPQNILVDPQTDRAMITDFGLARFSEDDSGVTQTGQMLGTPSFMPPEQIKDSSAIDVRADIYSVGGTLYQLLTGRPPFKAANMQETLRQVLSDDPVAPKRMNSGVELDLDTICLKCLEKDPDARYQTANDLADDLDAFLQGHPISARPASAMHKLAKWCHRNRRLAASIGTAIASTIALIVALAVGLAITVSLSKKIEKQRDVQAELAFIAIEDIDSLFGWLNDEPLFRQPGVEATRQRLLKSSLTHYNELAEFCVGKSDLKAERAIALTAMGSNALELSLPNEQAEDYFQEALELMPALVEGQKQPAKLWATKSNALRGLGVIQSRKGEIASALKNFELATEVRRSWAQLYPEDLEAARKLANSIMNEGMMQRSLAARTPDRARELLEESERNQIAAQELRQQLAAKWPDNPRLARDIAQGEFNLAFLANSIGDSQQVRTRLANAMNGFKRLTGANPSDFSLWRKYVETRIQYADFLVDPSVRTLVNFEVKKEASELLASALADLRALISLSTESTKVNPYSMTLIGLYQKGIDSLIYMDRSASEEELVGYLAMAEDEWQHLRQQLNELEIAFTKDPALETLRPQVDPILINAQKQKAMLSALLDNPNVASQNIASAIDYIEGFSDLVATNPRIASDLNILRAMQNDLMQPKAEQPTEN